MPMSPRTVARYPQATFRSVTVDWRGTRGTVLGDLSIHGVTRRVPLEVSYEGHARDPWGADRAIFSAKAQVGGAGYASAPTRT
jgi:polyisoprenoid-binding protein YceI